MKLDPDNEYYYKIREAAEYDPNEAYYVQTLTEDVLQAEYGLNVEEMYMVDVESRARYYFEDGGYDDEGQREYLEVVKIENKWYIAQPSYLWNESWYEDSTDN